MNVETIMYRDFKQLAQLVQSGSATQKIYKHGLYGGYTHSKLELNQYEMKTQAIWTLKRASRVLNEVEAVYCMAQFGGYLDADNKLQGYIGSKTKYVTLTEIEAILEYIFIKREFKNLRLLQYKFGWSNGQRIRRIATVKRFLAKLHNDVLIKLESALNAEIIESEQPYL